MNVSVSVNVKGHAASSGGVAAWCTCEYTSVNVNVSVSVSVSVSRRPVHLPCQLRGPREGGGVSWGPMEGQLGSQWWVYHATGKVEHVARPQRRLADQRAKHIEPTHNEAARGSSPPAIFTHTRW